MTTSGWATPATVTAAARRAWDNGTILRALHVQDDGERNPFPLRVRLPGPTKLDLDTRFRLASEWGRTLKDAAAGRGWQLLTRRTIAPGLGPQEMPTAAVIPTPWVALSLLGAAERRDAATFATALEHLRIVASTADELRSVALAKPLDVVAVDDGWPLLVAAASWVAEHPRPDVYIREVPVAGMHTKLIERHRPLFARMLTAVLPPEAVRAEDSRFEARFGFRAPRRRVRVRGSRLVLGVPPGPDFGDVDWDVTDLARLDPTGSTAKRLTQVVVVENLLSFLVVPEAPGRLIVWGAGYGADELLSHLPWIQQVDVRYWGDIDTHGFAMLAAVRKVAPQAVSVLMDVETLTTHREFHVREPKQATASLPLLTSDEARVYEGLRSGAWGTQLRLEQERISFDKVAGAFGWL